MVEMTNLRRMEELTAKIHDRVMAFHDIWDQWYTFVEYREMKSALGYIEIRELP